jgi:hypothetical protein
MPSPGRAPPLWPHPCRRRPEGRPSHLPSSLLLPPSARAPHAPRLQVSALVSKYPLVLNRRTPALEWMVGQLRHLAQSRPQWQADADAISPSLLAFFLRDFGDQVGPAAPRPRQGRPRQRAVPGGRRHAKAAPPHAWPRRLAQAGARPICCPRAAAERPRARLRLPHRAGPVCTRPFPGSPAVSAGPFAPRALPLATLNRAAAPCPPPPRPGRSGAWSTWPLRASPPASPCAT